MQTQVHMTDAIPRCDLSPVVLFNCQQLYRSTDELMMLLLIGCTAQQFYCLMVVLPPQPQAKHPQVSHYPARPHPASQHQAPSPTTITAPILLPHNQHKPLAVGHRLKAMSVKRHPVSYPLGEQLPVGLAGSSQTGAPAATIRTRTKGRVRGALLGRMGQGRKGRAVLGAQGVQQQ